MTEILDPEDQVLGRTEQKVNIGKDDGSWQQVITPDKAISFDDLIWQRLRYRFEYDDNKLATIEGIESISQILRRPVVRIIGQTQYLAGSVAAVRVIVSEANNNDVAENGSVRIELIIPDQKPRPLFSGRLNRRGTLDAQPSFSRWAHRQVRTALHRGHSHRLDRVHAIHSASGQGIHPPNYGEADLSAWADHARPCSRARPRGSQG